MWLGSEPPVLVYDERVVQLPTPARNGRKERYVPVGKVYENILGELVPRERKWRFEAEYEFGVMSEELVDLLLEVYNRSAVVKWIPHGDFPQVAHRCLLVEVEPRSVEGLVRFDTVRIKVRSKALLDKIPTVNALFGCFRFNMVGVY